MKTIHVKISIPMGIGAGPNKHQDFSSFSLNKISIPMGKKKMLQLLPPIKKKNFIDSIIKDH